MLLHISKAWEAVLIIEIIIVIYNLYGFNGKSFKYFDNQQRI